LLINELFTAFLIPLYKLRAMRNLFYFSLLLVLIWSCKSAKTTALVLQNKQTNTKISDTVIIANDELQYEVIIIDPGYSYWLLSRAQPRNYYSLSFLENKNIFFINEWNRRVNQPFLFDPKLYELRIDYDPNIHYGYEVNYLIYNYFIYFQNRYKQKL